jgi:hypothetical protein
MHASSLGDTQLGDDSLSMLTNLQRLGKDLERRKTSYYVREDAYKERVAALEEELASQNRGSPSGKKSESKLDELKMIQNEILESVELVQDRTARIMQEQERDLLRSFRARLFDVQTELEKEKGKKDDGLAAWRERYTQLEAELDWATEVSNRLDKVNQTLAHENSELKVKFNSQEQDRNLFIELLVSLKKDNALWRQKNSELVTENEARKVEVRIEFHLSLFPFPSLFLLLAPREMRITAQTLTSTPPHSTVRSSPSRSSLPWDTPLSWSRQLRFSQVGQRTSQLPPRLRCLQGRSRRRSK